MLGSNARMSAASIAASWLTDPNHVRKVIHEFNERGFDSLRPNYRGGRPRRITCDQRQRIVSVAGARPDTQGVPLTRWSLPRLAAYLAEQGIVQVSPAHLGRVLAEAGLSFQRTRTWKASPDPDYEAKTARVLELMRRTPPPDGVVIAFDQMGPVSLRPTAGCGLGAQRPARAPARGLQPPPRHPLCLRRLRRARRPAARQAAPQRARPGQPRVHGPDPRLLPGPPADLLDPGQPLGQLGPRHPHLRRDQPDRARRDPDLRELPQPRRVPLHADQPVRRRNADYIDWDAFAFALARHVTYRNGEHRDRRLTAAENRHRIAA